jgi:hypothetical protein
MPHGLTRKLGYDDLAQMPDDGLTRVILDGELFVTPALVEVLSASTAARCLECLRLEEGRYVTAASPVDDGALELPDWPGLTVQLAPLRR